MTDDQLIDNMKSEAENNRRPGWDSKAMSLLLQYCADRQATAMRGREDCTATDCLIAQIETWLGMEQQIKDIRNTLRVVL